jgi:type IV secretion system protein TrbL
MICALGVVLAFAIIAGQLLITLIESYIVIGAGRLHARFYRQPLDAGVR